MANQYLPLWSDMHSNIHHENFSELKNWYLHAKELLDFWPIAYYPFYMRSHPSGLKLEDIHPPEQRDADWNALLEFVREANAQGYPMFAGYEWQGAGLDGDHNVFFLHNNSPMNHPMRYRELRDSYQGADVIAVPHHLAYQLGSRGKNWDTHDPNFSPIAEIYSSHGSSEHDEGPLSMNRHIHMGPRTDETCYERGLERGVRCGAIASGDNHNAPAVFRNGLLCALAASRGKEDIWEALLARRTYGVSHSRIGMEFFINDSPMGSEICADQAELELEITGTNAIDRVEILRDNIVEDCIVHSGCWERQQLGKQVRIKLELQFGWGPDTRTFPDITSRVWQGSLSTAGRILSVEKCWNSFGQSLRKVSDQQYDFTLTTYKTTASGRWMGPSSVVNEGFIFELECALNEKLLLTVDGKRYPLEVQELLGGSRIIPLYKEAQELIAERWGDITHYRDDPWWHNAYKIKISRAVPIAGYTLSHRGTYPVERDCQYRLRVWQKNGHAAWSSPIFIRRNRA